MKIDNKKLVADRMKILEQFLVVNDMNYEDIEKKLTDELNNNPLRDPNNVLDNICNELIKERLNR